MITSALPTFPHLGLTDSTAGSYGLSNSLRVRILDQEHPLAGGLFGTPQALTEGHVVRWGNAASSGVIVAEASDSTGPAVVGFERGATLFGRTAAHRRVLLGTQVGGVDYAGRVLFGAAVSWATSVDTDRDGLSDVREIRLGSDPNKADTNDDGVWDGAALRLGLSLTRPDMDGDGVSNLLECQSGTNPLERDTDGDGIPDGADAYPLDRSRWKPPSPTPGDTTPPVIQLLEPEATPL